MRHVCVSACNAYVFLYTDYTIIVVQPNHLAIPAKRCDVIYTRQYVCMYVFSSMGYRSSSSTQTNIQLEWSSEEMTRVRDEINVRTQEQRERLLGAAPQAQSWFCRRSGPPPFDMGLHGHILLFAYRVQYLLITSIYSHDAVNYGRPLSICLAD